MLFSVLAMAVFLPGEDDDRLVGLTGDLGTGAGQTATDLTTPAGLSRTSLHHHLSTFTPHTPPAVFSVAESVSGVEGCLSAGRDCGT